MRPFLFFGDSAVAVLAAWIGLSVFIFAAATFLLVLILRIFLKLRTRREEELRKTWEPILAASAFGVPIDKPILRERDRDFFLHLWNHYQQSLRGDSKEELNRLARSLGLEEKALRDIESFRLGRRLMALMTIGHLKAEGVWEKLVSLTASRNVPISLMASRCLFQINASQAMPSFFRSLLQRRDWPPALVGALLKENSADVISEPLVRAAQEAPEDLKPRLIGYLKIAYPEKTIGVIHQILRTSSDSETIAAALRIVSDPTEIDVVQGYLKHAAWVVRMQAAKAVGRLGSREDEAKLIPLLGDQEWWVRYRSAFALAGLPTMTVTRMREIQSAHKDRYARDMMEQVIAERFAP